jgi:hypothetical protein
MEWNQDGIFFAEYKSYNEFEANDFERMRALAEQFPSAILAFCTLSKSLTPPEPTLVHSRCSKSNSQRRPAWQNGAEKIS